MHFYGLLSRLVVLLIRDEMHRSNVQLLKTTSEKKKITSQGLFISAMSHVKLIAETSVYICHKNMKSMGFLQFFESFRGKIYTKYSIGNEEWIEFETATITSDYVVHSHLSIS